MENTMCGARADFQTAGLNGVFAHFCRRGQKWVAPEREASPFGLLKEMGPPEAIKSDPRPQTQKKQEGSTASLLRGHKRIYLSAATDLTTLTSRPL